MKIRFFGCVHGKIDKISKDCQQHDIQMAVCCGDFQATRNQTDLDTMDALPKYRSLCDFPAYYNRQKYMPCPLLFVGGNHEASNHLREFVNGGTVADNIVYMGSSGVYNVGQLRIAGISGIHREQDYVRGYDERPPFNFPAPKTMCHIREFDVYRLLQLDNQRPIDIVVSHDWPQGIVDMDRDKVKAQSFWNNHPNWMGERQTLGSRSLRILLDYLQPRYWFCAHMHTKLSLTITHSSGKITQFIALGKVGYNDPMDYYSHDLTFDQQLQSDTKLRYDPEWLYIMAHTKDLRPVSKTPASLLVGHTQPKVLYRANTDQIKNIQLHFPLLIELEYQSKHDTIDSKLRFIKNLQP